MSHEDHFPSVGASTVLYFVRHGETEYNRRDIIQGSGIDSNMNATGRAQARALARRLSSVSIDVVYASPLRRAQQTAEIVTRPHESVSKTDLHELEEMDWGIFEGEPPSPERDETMERIKTTWRSGAFGRSVEGGESILDVQHRALRAVEYILTQDPGRTVLVVTHGRYLRVLLATLLEDYGLEHMNELDHSNTCVNRLVYEDGAFQADFLNCTAHLPSDTNFRTPA